MKKIDTLLKAIRDTELKLLLSKKELLTEKIDINVAGWIEKAQEQNQKFVNQNKTLLKNSSKLLLDNFESLNKQERVLLWDVFSKSNEFNTYFHVYDIDKKSNNYIKNSFLKVIIQDLGNDTRDALLEIDDIIEVAQENNIDYTSILSSLIPYVNTVDKHGMGSMESILFKLTM